MQLPEICISISKFLNSRDVYRLSRSSRHYSSVLKDEFFFRRLQEKEEFFESDLISLPNNTYSLWLTKFFVYVGNSADVAVYVNGSTIDIQITDSELYSRVVEWCKPFRRDSCKSFRIDSCKPFRKDSEWFTPFKTDSETIHITLKNYENIMESLRRVDMSAYSCVIYRGETLATPDYIYTMRTKDCILRTLPDKGMAEEYSYRGYYVPGLGIRYKNNTYIDRSNVRSMKKSKLMDKCHLPVHTELDGELQILTRTEVATYWNITASSLDQDYYFSLNKIQAGNIFKYPGYIGLTFKCDGSVIKGNMYRLRTKEKNSTIERLNKILSHYSEDTTEISPVRVTCMCNIYPTNDWKDCVVTLYVYVVQSSDKLRLGYDLVEKIN